jgi:hypothetical protein
MVYASQRYPISLPANLSSYECNRDMIMETCTLRIGTKEILLVVLRPHAHMQLESKADRYFGALSHFGTTKVQ